MELRLYDWQKECLQLWFDNGCKGIVNVVTGAGKTALAAAAIERLLITDKKTLRVKIVVPKAFLVRQWSSSLREYLQISREDIGVYSGSRKNMSDRQFMIYVINSARYSLARHILSDLSSSKPVFLVADECHHYGTEENSKIFDFYPWRPARLKDVADSLSVSNTNIYTLGLSATPHCEHYADVLVPCLGPEIYNFSFNHALNAEIINSFVIFHICLRFDVYEQEIYDELTDKIGVALSQLRSRNPGMVAYNSLSFFKELRNLAVSGDSETSELAKAVLILTYNRKGIVCHASSRIKCVFNLIRLIRKEAKIVIFGERIDMADEIYEGINGIFPNEAGIYHSGVHKSVGELALKRFEDGEIRILVSCRTLDEGLSVTGADVGIIVSSTNSTRQRIQRLGRILRKKHSGTPSYFYYLFIDGTTEETDILRDYTSGLERQISAIDLRYDEKTGEFINDYYDLLAKHVIFRAIDNEWTSEELHELNRNFKKGLIAGDWWLTEEECRKNITKAKNKSERNYYVAMLYLIRERLLTDH